MPIFSYRARKKQEEDIFEGLVEAESESLAVDILEERGFMVLFVEEKKTGLANLELMLGGVKAKDLVIFSRQLSILISAGVPVVESLKDVVNQTKNKKLKKSIVEVATEVEGGVKFSEALANHPKVFDNFFVFITIIIVLNSYIQSNVQYKICMKKTRKTYKKSNISISK